MSRLISQVASVAVGFAAGLVLNDRLIKVKEENRDLRDKMTSVERRMRKQSSQNSVATIPAPQKQPLVKLSAKTFQFSNYHWAPPRTEGTTDE